MLSTYLAQSRGATSLLLNKPPTHVQSMRFLAVGACIYMSEKSWTPCTEPVQDYQTTFVNSFHFHHRTMESSSGKPSAAENENSIDHLYKLRAAGGRVPRPD